jgi:hypothetical protein
MKLTFAHWRIIPNASSEEVMAVLVRDRVWNSFFRVYQRLGFQNIHQYVTGYAQLL